MSSFKLKCQVGSLPSNRLALTNKIYVSTENLQNIAEFYAQHQIAPVNKAQAFLVTLNGKHPYCVEGHPQIPNDQVAFNGLQRRFAQLSLAAAVTLQPLQPWPPTPCALIEFAVDTLSKKTSDPSGAKSKAKPKELDTERLAQTVLLILEEQVLEVGQMMAIDFEGTKLELHVKAMQALDIKKHKKSSSSSKKSSSSGDHDDTNHDNNKNDCRVGQLCAPTEIVFSRADGCTSLALTGSHIAEGAHGGAGGASSIFLNDFDFEKLGIGGLDAEFNQIFRRAFSSRIWPSHIIQQMGITHVRGMLLYGPPGCGK